MSGACALTRVENTSYGSLYVDEITQVLHDRFSGDGKPLLFLLHGKNTDS
jgi:hypothetical protein